MKKAFTLFFAFLAITVISQAQTLLSESFESFEIPAGWIRIDNDGDLYNWDPMNAFTGYNGGSCIISASYNGGALTPDNWLITSPVNLTSNAVLTFYKVDGISALIISALVLASIQRHTASRYLCP